MDESETLVIDRVPLVAGAGMLDCALSTVLSLVRVAEWRGNFERARAMLEQAESQGYQRGWGRLIAFVLSERIRLDLAEGRSAEAGACLERLERLASENPTTSLCAWSEIRSYASLGRAWIAAANDRLKESIDLLIYLQETHTSDHNHLAVLRFATHLAIVLFRANERGRAIVTFCVVASAASAARIDQFILEPGSQAGPLLIQSVENLHRTNANQQLSDYLQATLSRWRERYQRDGHSGSTSVTVDTLSARECSILERIGQGKSNKEIAKDLHIASETVKSHIKNIFAKLAVERRAQAVARAQSLGLVRTPP